MDMQITHITIFNLRRRRQQRTRDQTPWYHFLFPLSLRTNDLSHFLPHPPGSQLNQLNLLLQVSLQKDHFKLVTPNPPSLTAHQLIQHPAPERVCAESLIKAHAINI
jgi:hypothetical protein